VAKTYCTEHKCWHKPVIVGGKKVGTACFKCEEENLNERYDKVRRDDEEGRG